MEHVAFKGTVDLLWANEIAHHNVTLSPMMMLETLWGDNNSDNLHEDNKVIKTGWGTVIFLRRSSQLRDSVGKLREWAHRCMFMCTLGT